MKLGKERKRQKTNTITRDPIRPTLITAEAPLLISFNSTQHKKKKGLT